MPQVKDIAELIENFAPKSLQEGYDNSGLQVGDPQMEVNGVLVCLDVTEEIIEEAMARNCNMIVAHHPLIFKAIKEITGSNSIQRRIILALKNGIAVYSAHTNLDSAFGGINYEIAHLLNLKNISVMEPKNPESKEGLGIIGTVQPTPKLEFLRKIKDEFNVKCLRFSAHSPHLVINKVAACGGSGASLIKDAIAAKADILITADVKYHDFVDYAQDILIADIGHYESELCAKKLLSRIIQKAYPDLVLYNSQKEKNPINYI